MEDLCILIPVWPDYRWLAPLMLAHLERFWPGHPPVFLMGLTEEEAAGAAHFPVSDPALRRNWCWMVRDGVRQAAEKFRMTYLLAEEHLPLAPCHVRHLNHTLPEAVRQWEAVYISLMGWDNRRYASRNPILDSSRHRMMHLVRKHAPRFHLHPALWRLDVLERCCDIALRDERKRGSAWHFEKTCEKLDADLPEAWKKGCYQIAAHALIGHPARMRTISSLVDRWVFNRLTALVPLLLSPHWSDGYLRFLGFDDVYCDGPYPMIFSGVLQKGRLNRCLVRRLERTASGRQMLMQILQAHPGAFVGFA